MRWNYVFAFQYNLNMLLVSTVINLICFHNSNTDPLTRPSHSFLSAPMSMHSILKIVE